MLHSAVAIALIFILTIPCRGSDSTAVSFFNAGSEELQSGQLDYAYANFLRAKEEYLELGDTAGLLKVALKLGVLNDQFGNREVAREQFMLSLKLAESMGDSLGIGDALWGVGVSLLYEGVLDSAQVYLDQATHIYQEARKPERSSDLLNNHGVLLLSLEQYDEALKIFKQVWHEKQLLGDSTGSVATILNIGVVYLDQDQYDSSIFYLNTALQKSIEYELPDYERYALLNLGHLSYNFGEFQAASDFYWDYHLIEDSLYSAEMSTKIEQLETDFIISRKDLELKESQLKSAQRSKWFIGIASFLLLAVITVVLIYYRRISVHRARERALMEARESENKRISDLLWKEIGSAVKEKKLVLPGVELPEQSIGGAIEAAKFMANHQYNPFLQINLTRAVQHLMNNLTADKPFEFTLEADEIQLEKSEKLAVYRVIESLLVDAAENQRSGIIFVRLKAEASKLTIYIKSEKTNEKKTMMYRSAEARVDQLRGKIQRSNKGEFQQSEVLIPLN